MAPVTVGRERRYLLCEPRYFELAYAINPWMRQDSRVDRDRALEQWHTLVRTYRELGHTVELLEPVPGLPDMVFAANGALVLGGKVLGSRFHAAQRQPEAAEFTRWFKENGFPVVEPEDVCEGEGDLVPVGGDILAGYGFRTSTGAHIAAQEYFGSAVISLRLVDPLFYHLDTALFALDDTTIAYYPEAFSPGSRAALRRRYPDAVIATRADAMAFGLNSVSDGHHVLISPGATGLIDRLTERGYTPVPVDTSELLKAGGGIKCCTQEIRHP
ncbi:N(G),N(G)-dimethylarginine dimethylaminohydrolase [Streptomyces sp. enrichment culture]|uniref:dimethylargininase n=1 Tax=Streptomyces xiamenensis TaxID=408015 RepID=UPI0036EC61C3